MSSSKQSKKQLLAPGRGYSDSNRSRNASTTKGGSKNQAFASTRSTQGGSATKRTTVGAISEKSGPIRAPVQILDESGKDVTPLPLLHSDPNALKNKQNLIGDSSIGTPTELMSQASASIYGTQGVGNTTTTSMFGGGPFTRSVFTQSYDTGDSIPPDESGSPDVTTFTEVRHKRQEVQEIPTDDDLYKTVDITLTETDTIWMFELPDIKVSKEAEEQAVLSERNRIYQELQKTRVGNDLYAERGMNTFNEPPKMKSVSTVKIDTTAVGVECTNWDMFDTYDAIDKEKKAKSSNGDDEDVILPSSTALAELAAKEEAEDEEGTISRPTSPKEDAGPDAAADKDAVSVSGDKSVVEDVGSRVGSAVATGRESKMTQASSMLGSEVQSTLETIVELSDRERLTQEWTNLAKSEKLRHHLFLMERVVNLNTYQNKQALYRGFFPLTAKGKKKFSLIFEKEDLPITGKEKKDFGMGLVSDLQGRKSSLEADVNVMAETAKHLGGRLHSKQDIKDNSSVSMHDMGPNLDRLWSYTCSLTKNKNVSCVTWNKSNLDLVAVGYGQFEFTNQKNGIVCCWCIKNPEYPERIFTSKHGVTAVDFSTANANLLAVGYYDGGIAVYNVRKSLDEPVLDNFTTNGKHLAPVWQLKWIEKERGSGEERAEVLISISTDGRVTQWSIRKGFESYDVMKLKKMPTRMAGRAREKKGEAFISRYAGGMCFDFHSRDTNIYLTGTEEGFIHKCSCSHNEQYLESYSGHTAPVYSIQWSPFVPDIFLSCSADWTIKLWHQDKTKPILSFHSCTKAVNDICWSPWSSTVFACVNEGAVEVWDLAHSTLDAVYTLSPTSGAKQTSVSFSRNSQCLLVGDSEGQVTVYELRSMPPPPEDQQLALETVIDASLASQLPGATEGAGDMGDEDGEPEL